MRLENVGPSGVWNSLKDDWLITPQAARLFLVSTIFVLALIPVLQGMVDPARMMLWMRIPLTIFAMIGTLALLFLWIGMWKYFV